MNVRREGTCRRIVRLAFHGWIAVSFATAVVAASGQPQNPNRFKGRPLASALVRLQESGLKIIFSTELVRPDMIVSEEPRGRQGPEILDELLAPHGLRSSPGPSGARLVVKAPAPKTAPGGKAEKKPPQTPKEPEVLQVREHVDVRAGDPSLGKICRPTGKQSEGTGCCRRRNIPPIRCCRCRALPVSRRPTGPAD